MTTELPSLIPAREVAPEAPPDLRAWRLYRRPVVGPSRRVYAGGDVGFCGRLSAGALSDMHEPWNEVAAVLRGGDIAFANLETPLVDDVASVDPTAPSSPFVGRARSAGSLATAGFDVISLANNHVADAGPDGVESTLVAIEATGLRAVGAGRDPAAARSLVTLDLGGLRVGWLACARTLQEQVPGPGFWELDSEELLAAIRRHRGEVDVLVVSLHLGYMFVEYPSPEHRNLVLAAADAGAHLVLCHHAHVFQGIEMTAGGSAVCHNLGNLLLDWTVGEIPFDGLVEEQRRGVVMAIDIDREGVCGVAALPTRVDETMTLRWASGEVGAEILGRLDDRSRALASDFTAQFRRQRAQRNTGLAIDTVLRQMRRGGLRAAIGLVRRFRPHHLGMMVRWLRSRVAEGVGR